MRTREALSSDTESDTSADLVLGAYRALDSPGGPGTRLYAEEQRTIPCSPRT